MKNYQATFKAMAQKALPHVKHYRTDIRHDFNAMRQAPGVPFIHIARECGTYLTLLLPADHKSWPAPGERVRYLFGYADRNDILRDLPAHVDYAIKEGNAKLAQYYNGRKLTSISIHDAHDIVAAHMAKVRYSWDTIDNRKGA